MIGNFVDAKDNRSLVVGALVIDNNVYKPDAKGLVYLELLPGKHNLSARFYSYKFVNSKIIVHNSDSVRFTFHLEKSNEILK
jgi:hypothetical protein